MSYPLRVRGLKLLKQAQARRSRSVVSFTGTWIETHVRYRRYPYGQSYPLRVRGLKPLRYVKQSIGSESRILYGYVD